MSRTERSLDPEIADQPLIATKLALPPRRPGTIVRPRLLRMLDDSHAPLTIIDAPLGYGKTVLAQTWCQHQRDAAVAWVSLDESDNNPVRLWTYIATAVDRVRNGLGRAALARLRVPGSDIQGAVTELLNGAEAYREPLVLVLDDLHLVSDPETFSTVRFAVNHLPHNLRILATTRHDPQLPLARMRSNSRLLEIRARDLAFTAAEGRALLVDQAGLALDDQELELLVDRTEGWPAGVYLAQLWLQRTDNTSESVRDFHANHRHVADYLTTDVLDTIEPEQRDFLVKTSVLDRFSASLCDAILGRTDSDRLLGLLFRANLFLIPIDEHHEWFRYHKLFRELLRLELVSAEPSAPEAICTRAQNWFLRHGLVEEAVDYAFRSGDDDAALQIILSHYRSVMESSRESLLLGWLARLSSSRLAAHPELAVAGALVAGISSRSSEERRRLVAIASSALESQPDQRDEYVQGMVALARTVWMDGDVGAAVRSGREAVRLTEAAGGDFAVPALAALAHALLLCGQPADAEAFARRAAEHPQAPNRPYAYIGALSVLAMIDAAEGRVRAADDHATEAAAIARKRGIDRAWISGLARLARAAAAEVGGDLRVAEREALAASRLYEGDIDLPYAYARLVLAGLQTQLGHLRRAEESLAEGKRAIAGFADPGMLLHLLHQVEGRLQEAHSRLHERPLIESPSEAELAVLRLLLDTELSLRQIGDALFISLNTVKSHTRELYRKLGVGSRSEAITRAQALGLLGDESPG